MTAPYQVFVDGPRDRSPQAVARLAVAIGARYGLPAADLERRLTRGRFKVKAGIDRATAEQYVSDLEQLGAICAIVDATGATVELAVARGSVPPAPRQASGPLPPRQGAAPPRQSALPPPARSAAPPRSGLAAARADAAADLGALGRDDGAMALSALDGEGEAIIEHTSHLPASFGPAASPAPAAAAAAAPAAGARVMTGPPVDLFTAPEGEDEMELALDVVETRKPAPDAPAGAAPRGTMAPELVAPAPPRPAGPPLAARARGLLASARVRFAAGVVVAVLLGFIPAHIVAGVRERAAFAEVDDKLHDRFAAVTSPEEYAALDKARARALDRKYTDRRDIALTALLIWAAVGAGLAYVWFRRVPWDRIAPRPA